MKNVNKGESRKIGELCLAAFHYKKKRVYCAKDVIALLSLIFVMEFSGNDFLCV